MKKKLITFFLLVEDVTCCKGVIYGTKIFSMLEKYSEYKDYTKKTVYTREDEFFAP